MYRHWPAELLRLNRLQVSSESEFFANLVVDAVSVLDPQTLDLKMIGMKKVRSLSMSWPTSGPVCQHRSISVALCTLHKPQTLFVNRPGFPRFANALISTPSSAPSGAVILAMQVQGGGLKDSFLVDGVAFKKTFSYAGFEMQPRSFDSPKVLLLNIELELKAEKENAEVRTPALPSAPLHRLACLHRAHATCHQHFSETGPAMH